MIKHLLKILCLLCAFALVLPFAAASERSATLHAINMVENPTNHTRPGSRGELGPYQFLPHTWRMHTRVPFRQAIAREHSDAVAVKHYEWIKDGLVAAGIDPNPYNIALAWNCGLGAVTAGRIPTVSYSYAERVQNLVEQQRARPSRAVAIAPKTEPKPAPQTASMFVVDTSGAPRFVVATTEPLFEPVVHTDKSIAAPTAPESIPVVTIAATEAAKPVLAFNAVPTPRLALMR